MEKTTRFAPSPTGLLHAGHAFAAKFAAGAGDRMLLRIEDLDQTRCRPAFEQAILEDLQWLDIKWEMPLLRQTDRLTAYDEALARLRALDLLYPCICTRKEIEAEVVAMGSAPHGPVNGPLGVIYPGTCRHRSADEIENAVDSGRAPAWRLKAAEALARTGPLTWSEDGEPPQAVDITAFGDIPLARKDTGTSYHLAVVVDDAFQGVTLVTRAEDLKASTGLHRLLYALLDLPEPRWRHHPLITDEHGKRFAKRNQSVTLKSLREAGWTADQLWESLTGGTSFSLT